ncbi:MAG: DUF4492 domain-containing protein [Muribaculaceae bacterium]|nr:DUF4492 domain-containing protein [Muribaculaceae bacterium]
MKNWMLRVYEFYRQGFASMTVGRTLWLVIAIKVAIIFLVLKLWLFPNYLNTEYDSDAERSGAVRSSLIHK